MAWVIKSSSSYVSPMGDPMSLAYALSIHRLQGLMPQKAAVDIRRNEFSLGLTCQLFTFKNSVIWPPQHWPFAEN